jgi:hypothetical protein
MDVLWGGKATEGVKARNHRHLLSKLQCVGLYIYFTTLPAVRLLITLTFVILFSFSSFLY